jgi:hypothetical protein
MCVCVEAHGAPIGAAALEVGDLLDARIEFRLPRIFWDVDIFAVEYIVDGVGTTRCVSNWSFEQAMMSLVATRYVGSNKSYAPREKSHLQAVSSLK